MFHVNLSASGEGASRIRGKVVRNGKKPSGKFRVGQISRPGAVDPQKNFLSKIFGEVPTPHQMLKNPEKPILVPAHQFLKRPCVAVLNAEHQANIRVFSFIVFLLRLAARQATPFKIIVPE